jgi:hypothetical protein
MLTADCLNRRFKLVVISRVFFNIFAISRQGAGGQAWGAGMGVRPGRTGRPPPPPLSPSSRCIVAGKLDLRALSRQRSSPGAKPKPFGPLLSGFLSRHTSHALHDSSTSVRARPRACWAEEVLYLEVWPEAWAAWWHSCSSLVVWAYRREVEVARELLGVVEDLKEDAHAPACMLCRALRVWSGMLPQLCLGSRCCGTFALPL